jgi:hypothetical protein
MYSESPLQKDGDKTGQTTPALDRTATPPTPRSITAKPSVFKKTNTIQKISLNKEFLKNLIPASTTQPISSVPKVPEKRVSFTILS